MLFLYIQLQINLPFILYLLNIKFLIMDKSNTAVIWILVILILSITVYLMIHYCKKHFSDDSVQRDRPLLHGSFSNRSNGDWRIFVNSKETTSPRSPPLISSSVEDFVFPQQTQVRSKCFLGICSWPMYSDHNYFQSIDAISTHNSESASRSDIDDKNDNTSQWITQGCILPLTPKR